ncbi:MAG: twin transmembrane helix small protein [Alphaproteobacteria bacterium]|nr:twin transmembrane helix small protein [Alphaproteobacteria bacterium]
MPSPSNLLVIVAVAAVALVVVAGFVNMFRGGHGAPARAQKLMRWRVGLQLLALLIVLGVLYARGRW